MTLLLIVLLPFAGAILPPLMIRVDRTACAVATGGVTALALFLLLQHAPAVLAGQVVTTQLAWIPALGLDLHFMLDGLGLLFAGLILGMGLLIIVYSRGYLDPADPMGRFYAFLLLFQGAMVGIVLSDNILLLLFFWELTSLSSFLLIGYWRHSPEGRQGARMALAVTGGGGFALMAGLLILGDIAGSYDLSVILTQRESIQASPLYVPALVLILLGCFTKSAQFPFHFWLPHAMAAPTPVSAYLHSATMVKAGLFLMARLSPALAGSEAWFYLVATTGLVTMVIAAWIALFKDDLKALLAFSTVSHLGLVTMLLGFATPLAAMAALFHVINHATFKAALFMTAGMVDHGTGTRDLRRLGGLLGLMPITGTLALVAGASMAGLPPFNGFISKEMMLEETMRTAWLDSPWLLPLLATIGAALSAAYSFRYVIGTFLGAPRGDYPRHPHDPSWTMWLPPALLVVLVVAIGLAPAMIAEPLTLIATASVTGGILPQTELSLWHGITPALGLSLVALTAGALLLWRHADVDGARLRLPRPEGKAIYERTMWCLIGGARQFTERVQNGSLQRYMAMLVGATLVAGAVGWVSASHLPGQRAVLPITALAIVLWLLAIGACAATVALHRRRLLSLVLIAVVGLIVSMTFLYFSAPDLALTQISVEVITVILLLLALNFLPKETPRDGTPARHARDGILAGLAGLGAAGAAWALLTRDVTTISDYHVANSYSGGGGTNVVNVILVDFRGYDTFGEIIVLGIAALAIFALLDSALHGDTGRRLRHWTPDPAQSPDVHPLLLVVVTRAMLPLTMMVGIYILLRGHNEPGGGFIAGLVISIALVMQYMASGFEWAHQRMKVDYHALIACGVLVAGITGVGAWFADRPFLTSDYGYFALPLFGQFELATAMAFDLGVFLTVVGAVMLALANLSRVGRRAEPQPVAPSPMTVDPSAPTSHPREARPLARPERA